jgi:four helix bundle suffix protein
LKIKNKNMTNKTNKTDDNLMFKHGGYRELKSYQMSTIVYDATVEFCKSYVDKFSRTNDQMVQAARSGRQNIAEGSRAAGTSKKSELKLTNVARASLEELLLDYEDFIRQNGLRAWTKDDLEAKKVRNLCYGNLSYESYKTYLENSEQAANMLICIIHQTNYLLDQQLRKLEQELLNEGGFTERLYSKRRDRRGY